MKHILKIFSFILLYFSAVSVFAQTNIEKAEKYNELAITENQNKNFDKAIQYISQAIKISEVEHNNELDGKLRYTAALIYSNRKENSLALNFFLSSANFFEKTQAYEMLSKIYSQTQQIYFEIEAFGKAAENGKKAILFSIKNNNTFEETAKFIEKTGDSYFYIPNNDSAIHYYNLLKEKSIQNNNVNTHISSLQKLSNVYKRKKDYKNALQINIELNNIYTKNNNTAGMSVSKNNIAFNHMLLTEYSKAETEFQEAITLGKKAGFNNAFIANTYTNIGICHQNSGNLQDAVINLNKALEIWKAEKKNKETAKILNLIALVYYNSGDLYNASTHSEESINYALSANNKETLSDCYRTYSKILQEGNDYEQALEIYKKHLSINDSLMMEQKMHDQNLAQKIFDLERSEKDLKLQLVDEEVKNLAYNQLKLEAEKKEKELELLKKEKELEVSESDRLMQIMKLTEQQHKTILKEQEIKNLEAQKSIQEMKLQQKEMQEQDRKKELALLQSKSDKQKLELEKNKQSRQKFQWIFGLVIVILALIVFALFSSIKSNKKLAGQKRQILEKNEELNLQNEKIKAQKEYLQNANEEINTQKLELENKTIELENKNDEITASINYAQKIQFAILPPMEILSKEFPENFILYKPKDIVSGDFYWTKKIGDYHVVAIADCTGHGVPGAFMSMLGISFLNEIVTKTRFDSAGEVLNRLRNKVKKALRQTGRTREQKDGMDISLIVINKEEMTLQFAGANNSLVYIRNNKLDILKADRMPIGIYHKEADFQNHHIKIKPEDIIYAYSDGYQDQFGGPKGRKFLSKRLKELLLDIHQKPIKKQKQIFENTLTEWTSYKDPSGLEYPQVDDILVFGLKV